MKKIIFALCTILPLQVFAQKTVWINTASLLNVSTNDSAIVANAIDTQASAWRSSTSQDTILSKWVMMEGLTRNFSVEFRYANVTGTDSVDFFIHLFRGIGTPDSTGFSRHTLTSGSTSDLTTFYTLDDSSFVSNRYFSKYRFEIREGKAVQNDYIINVNHYSEKDHRPRLIN